MLVSVIQQHESAVITYVYIFTYICCKYVYKCMYIYIYIYIHMLFPYRLLQNIGYCVQKLLLKVEQYSVRNQSSSESPISCSLSPGSFLKSHAICLPTSSRHLLNYPLSERTSKNFPHGPGAKTALLGACVPSGCGQLHMLQGVSKEAFQDRSFSTTPPTHQNLTLFILQSHCHRQVHCRFCLSLLSAYALGKYQVSCILIPASGASHQVGVQ